MMNIQNAQLEVDNWIKDHGVRYFNELTNMAQLTEEVGEVARIIARRYGEQSEKESDKKLEQVKRMLTYLPKHSFTRRSAWRIMKQTNDYKKLATAIIQFAKNKQNEFSADEKTFKVQLSEIYTETFNN
jgi:thymidylate synthase